MFLGAIDVERKETKRLSNFVESIERKRFQMQESCFETVRDKEIPSPLFILTFKMIVGRLFPRRESDEVERPDV